MSLVHRNVDRRRRPGLHTVTITVGVLLTAAGLAAALSVPGAVLTALGPALILASAAFAGSWRNAAAGHVAGLAVAVLAVAALGVGARAYDELIGGADGNDGTVTPVARR